MGKSKKAAPEPRRFTETLAVQLTVEEIAAYADMAARIAADADAREEGRASQNKAERDGIELMQGQVRDYLRRVREKRDYRPVDCEETMDWARNAVRVFRTDTEELVRERAMTTEERQQRLFELPQKEGEGEGAGAGV